MEQMADISTIPRNLNHNLKIVKCHRGWTDICYLNFTFFFKLKKKKHFWLHRAACEILVPQPGTELSLPGLEAQSLNHWTAGEVLLFELLRLLLTTVGRMGWSMKTGGIKRNVFPRFVDYNYVTLCKFKTYRVLIQFSSVQSLNHVQLFATPWTEALQASLSITNSQSSLKLVSIELVMPSNHLIFCHPLLLLP